MGDHRIMRLIGELFNVEVLLDNSFRVRQKGPRGAECIAELIDVQLIVGGDENQARVCVSEVGIPIDQVLNKPMLFRVEATPG